MKNLLAFFIILLGLGFLLTNLGIIEGSFSDILSTYWPIAVIWFGLKWFFQGIPAFFQSLKRDRKNIGQIIWGLYVTMIGSVLLGNNLGYFDYTLGDVWNWTWPVLIIYFGFKILFDREGDVVIHLGPDDVEKYTRKSKSPYHDDPEPMGVNDKISKAERKAEKARAKAEAFADGHTGEGHKSFERFPTGSKRSLIGDFKLGKKPWEPDGQDLSLGIGDVEIDFTKAVLKEGRNQMRVNCWIGDVNVLIPRHIPVKVEAEVKLGEVTLFDDSYSGTGRSASYTSPDFDDAKEQLIILIQLNIGDIEVMTVD